MFPFRVNIGGYAEITKTIYTSAPESRLGCLSDIQLQLFPIIPSSGAMKIKRNTLPIILITAFPLLHLINYAKKATIRLHGTDLEVLRTIRNKLGRPSMFRNAVASPGGYGRI